MPKRPSRAKSTGSKKGSLDQDRRQEFLDELEGRVPIENLPPEHPKSVEVTKDEDAPGDEPAGPKVDVPPEAEAIFSESSPKTENSRSTFEQAKKRVVWPYVVGGLVLLAGLATAGFFVFLRSDKFNTDNVHLAIESPETVASGSNIEVTIRYSNDETVEIRNALIALRLPDGFSFASSSIPSVEDNGQSFEVGTVKPAEVGELVIHGTLVGTVGDTVEFSGSMSYRPANFNSDFTVDAIGESLIQTSNLVVRIDGAKQLAPGAVSTWTIEYQNTSSQTIKNAQLDVELPENLRVTERVPKATSGTTTWRFTEIKSGGKGKVKITGSFRGAAGDSGELKAVLSLVQAGGALESQAETSLLVSLASAGIDLAVAANGTTGTTVISPGDLVTYSIKLVNSQDTELNDVRVTATFNGAILRLADRQDGARGTLAGQVLTWTKSTVSGLGAMAPDDSVTIDFSVPTIPPAPARADNDKNPSVAATVTVSSPDLPKDAVKAVVSTVKVQTTMSFSADARYYDDQGQALGSGPVPPKVGETTAYRIRWSATSTTNDIAAFTATTTLPSNVLWTGRNISRDAGTLTFDPTTRTVTWEVSRMPGGTGSRYPMLGASFEVSITPTADQVGNVVVLTEAATANGTDDFTDQKVSSASTSLTTEVPNDPQAAGEGKVMP